LKLSEITHSITDGKHGDCTPDESSGYYFISCKDIQNGKINYESARQITYQDYLDVHKRTKLEKHDILITNSGTIGRMCFVDERAKLERTTFQKSVAIVKPNIEKVDAAYLYYYLYRSVDELIRKAYGSSQKNLLLSQLRNIEVDLPNRETQIKIVNSIKPLDDKIHLNSSIIDDMEEYAQLLFNKWFVYFNFPDENGKPYKDNGGEMHEVDGKIMIPIGWKFEMLSESADFVNGLAMQSYPPKDEYDILPVIKIKEINNGGFNGSTEFMTNDIDKRLIIEDGDILFPWSASLGIYIWTGGKGGLNQHIFKVASNKYEKWYMYNWIKKHMQYFKQIAYGKKTTMGHINRRHLDLVNNLVPDVDTMDKMNIVMNPIYNKIILLKKEIKLLEETRDLLIKKLIK
jgi:type I restriction enzyme S subunit